MSDSIKGFVVALDRDYSEDDAKAIRQALLMIKGVVDVAPQALAPEDFFARRTIQHDLARKLFAVLDPPL